VKVHAQAVFRKIGARNRTHAAIIARENGFM
jgi:DNA-binding NarL/FixJ family response regulator